MTVQLIEEDRQLMLLALAECSLLRPGFLGALAEIAEKVDPTLELFNHFREVNSDRIKPHGI